MNHVPVVNILTDYLLLLLHINVHTSIRPGLFSYLFLFFIHFILLYVLCLHRYRDKFLVCDVLWQTDNGNKLILIHKKTMAESEIQPSTGLQPCDVIDDVFYVIAEGRRLSELFFWFGNRSRQNFLL